MKVQNAQFKIIENGPIEVTGNIKLVDRTGREIETEGTVYLCRCGKSGNKPFCDDSHLRNGFRG